MRSFFFPLLLPLSFIPFSSSAAAQCDESWHLQSFGCDVGHDNFGTLNRNGTPACGHGNCPGPSCWTALSPSVTVSNASNGSITVQSPQDVQVYGETFVWATASSTISFSIQFLADCNLTVWLNGSKLTPGTSTVPGSGSYPMSLVAGQNHIEFTNYHQHASTGFRFNTQLAGHVAAMHSEPIANSGCASASVAEYGCGPLGLNPEGSLSHFAGIPVLGGAVVLEVHNPLGTQNPGAQAYVLLSTAAMPQFPCGPAIPGWSMHSNTLPGDQLISFAPAKFIGVHPPGGAPWDGTPAAVTLSVANNPALIGLKVFAQGFLIDPSPTGVLIGAATAVEIRIGL